VTDDLKQLETHWEALERGEEGAVHEVRKLSRQAGAVLGALEAPKKIQRAWRALRRAVAPQRLRVDGGEGYFTVSQFEHDFVKQLQRSSITHQELAVHPPGDAEGFKFVEHPITQMI